MQLENECYCVRVDRRGAICGFYDKASRLELIAEPRLAENWRLLLPLPREGLTNRQVNYIESARQAPPACRVVGDTLELRWEGPLVNDQGAWDVAVLAGLRLNGPEVEQWVEVRNHSGLTLAEVWYGGFGGSMGVGKRTETETLIPDYNAAITTSLFRHFPESLGVGGAGGFRFPEFFISYPEMTMPWVSMWNPRMGRALYYACHDLEPRKKVFHAEMHPTLAHQRVGGNWPTDREIAARRRQFPPGLVLHWVHLPYLEPGRVFRSATVILRCHDGDWHDAAKLYRRWFTSHFSVRRPADAWLRREQAVQDTVMLLPEGNVIHTFRDIPALARGACRYGVTTIMISGWWKGGHDNQYPAYVPDERLGTWDDLRRGIAACHKLGVKVLFFANIDTVDTSTAWYRKELRRYRVVRGNGSIRIMGWGMGTLSARMGQTMPPLSSCDVAFDAYRQIIVTQMRRLAELGADGVHFDKVNCHDLDFNPRLSGERDRVMFAATLRCMEETLAACRPLVPHFALSVEGSWDRFLSYVDAWWNWVDNPDHVPAIKYAFPEWMANFVVTMAHDYNEVNSAIRYGYQMLIGPIRWSQSLADPQMSALARYIREAIRIREQLQDTIFLGEYLDTLEAVVQPQEHLRYNTHRNPRTGQRACVLANYGRKAVGTTVKFDGNARGRVAIYRPFAKVTCARLPVTLSIPGERFAVVVEV